MDNNFFNLTEAGVYYDTLQSANGCDSIVCLTLMEYSSSTPDLSLTRVDNSFVIAWQESASSYQLYRNNEWLATIGTTNYTDNDLTDGMTYCYTIKAINGDRENELCEEVCETFNTVGIVETQCIASLRIYPNPTTGQLTIENGQLTIENVEIFSIVGQRVGAYPCGRPETTIDVSHLANGMYYLKIGDRTVRFVKE